MAEPTLTITYDEKGYSLQIELRDSLLWWFLVKTPAGALKSYIQAVFQKKYSQQQEPVKKKLKARMSEIFGDLSLPSNLQRIIDRMDQDHLERKLNLIEGYKNNGVGEQ